MTSSSSLQVRPNPAPHTLTAGCRLGGRDATATAVAEAGNDQGQLPDACVTETSGTGSALTPTEDTCVPGDIDIIS